MSEASDKPTEQPKPSEESKPIEQPKSVAESKPVEQPKSATEEKTKEMKIEEEKSNIALLEKEIHEGRVKRCFNASCVYLVEKDGGCNYVKCKCGCEMCWICNQIKYSGCNDKSHNSH